jgi:regulator of ribonuclease activity A
MDLATAAPSDIVPAAAGRAGTSRNEPRARDVSTCDLYDRHEERARVPAIPFQVYGGRRSYSGPAVTVKCFEDNSIVRDLCQSPGNGRVLVVDGAGSLRCSLVGGSLARVASENGWAGIILHGCVRDSAEINGLRFGIHALGTVPRKSVRRGLGLLDVEVRFGGITWRPGDQVFADQDGVVVLDEGVEP